MTVYFDNAATSWPKPASVYTAAARALVEVGASPGRAAHRRAREAAAIVTEARSKVAAFLGIDDPARVVFTKKRHGKSQCGAERIPSAGRSRFVFRHGAQCRGPALATSEFRGSDGGEDSLQSAGAPGLRRASRSARFRTATRGPHPTPPT